MVPELARYHRPGTQQENAIGVRQDDPEPRTGLPSQRLERTIGNQRRAAPHQTVRSVSNYQDHGQRRKGSQRRNGTAGQQPVTSCVLKREHQPESRRRDDPHKLRRPPEDFALEVTGRSNTLRTFAGFPDSR